MASSRNRKTPSRKARKKSVSRKSNNRFSLKRITVLALLALGLAIVLSGWLLYWSVSRGVFGPLPDETALRNIRNQTASEIYASDGVLLGKFYLQDRSEINYGEISDDLIAALIATEDSRFFEHGGVDPWSVLRVVFKSVLLGDRKSGGGSTISQQLAKNLFGRKDHNFLSAPVNKLKENILAVRIENIYSKEEIITLYLNTVSFGEDVYGIKAAASRYFGKLPSALKTEEAALLVGMLKAPTTYNPRLHPEAAKERRNTVLAQMYKYDYLERENFIALSAKPLVLNYKVYSGSHGLAPYLRERLRGELEKLCGSLLKPNGEPYNLYTDGLKIYTTIHSEWQMAAEKALKDHLAQLQDSFDQQWGKEQPWGKSDLLRNEMKRTHRYRNAQKMGKSDQEIQKEFTTPVEMSIYTHAGMKKVKLSPLDSITHHQRLLQAGFVAINNHTGAVLAYVGGPDHRMFPYDHVTARRQVGSTFKPLVYAAALEHGMDPCKYLSAAKEVYPELKNWAPANSDGQYDGFYTMGGALARSVNTVSVKIIVETGVEPTIQLAKAMGITSDLPNVPSLALGTANVSLFEMVRAYTTFANEGRVVTPWMVSRIEDSEGRIIQNITGNKGAQVLSKESAQTMLHMLRAVADTGTARRIKQLHKVKSPVAGKTGTTQNNADGWFICNTPSVTMGAWVGGDNPLVRFKTTALGQGANTALPIVAKTLLALEGKPERRKEIGTSFPRPDDAIMARLNCIPWTENPLEEIPWTPFDKEQRKERKEIREQIKKQPPKEKKGFFQKLFGKG